jgi:outer membrane protein TolC
MSVDAMRTVACVWLGAIVGALAAVPAMLAAGPLSYEDARSALHTVSHLQAASEAALRRSEREADAAGTLRLPEVSLNYTRIYGTKTGTLETPIGAIPIDLDLDGPRPSINSTWSLYTGGKISATQRALAAHVDQARAELAGTGQHLDFELTQVYFGVVLAANVERTRTQQLDVADRQLERAMRFEQQGIIPMVERLSAQVSRDEAARELVRAKSDRRIADARLQRLLQTDMPVEPITPLFVITHALDELPEWLAIAERQNPILSALGARQAQAEQGVVLAKSLWKPSVFAFGSYSLNDKYHTLVEPDWIAGVGVNFTIVSRIKRSSKVAAAEEELQQVQSLQEESRNVIDTAVETAYRKVEQARDQFQLLESALAATHENLRLRERGFDEGQATSLDVNDARDSVARAETARALSAYEFVVALAQLLEASGQAHALPDYIQRADERLPP